MPSFDVVVVGAGFAGLYLLHRLREQGLKAVALEKGAGIGGTWFWNAYPGARCDVESLEYSFSFSPELQAEWQWTERYATQPEILKYLNHVADRFNLRPDVRLKTFVKAATFEDGKWRVTAVSESAEDGKPAHEETTYEARYFILATGALSEPVKPDVKGLERFQGELYYPNTTPNPKVDFTGKRVAIMGTGSTGIQMTPIVADQAKELFVVQRSAMFSFPAHNAMAGEREAKMREQYATLRAMQQQAPFLGFTALEGDLLRKNIPIMSDTEEERCRVMEYNWEHFGGLYMGLAYPDIVMSEEANQWVCEWAKNKIRSLVKDPAVAEKLMPNHLLASRRACVDTGYFNSFNKPNVHLISAPKESPVQYVDETGFAVAGTHYDVDVIVLATGFDQFMGPINKIDIRGTDKATTLREAFNTAPVSLWGMIKPGFPNLFTINGPGSPSVLTNMVSAIEFNADYVLNLIKHIDTNNLRQVEADPTAEMEWFGLVQFLAMQATVFGKGAKTSPYAGANVEGKNKAWLPFIGHPMYAEKLNAAAAAGYTGAKFA